MSASRAELMREIEHSEGLRVSLEMNGLAATYYIFERNAIQVLTSIDAFEGLGSKPWDVEKRNDLTLLHQEVTRLLHNWLAAAMTLVDHTRNIMSSLYGGKNFQVEYDLKVGEAFHDSEVSGFVQGLRNWMLHKGLLPVVVTLQFGADEKARSRVVLSLDELVGWDKWDKRAKGYVAKLSSDHGVRETVSEYTAAVSGFYRWLETRMRQVHATAFDELDRLQTQLCDHRE